MATLAGAEPSVAARLAASMVALQVSIGALNDLADRDLDVVAKPRKPVAAGLVPPALAGGVAVAGLLAGLLLSLGSGLATAAVALLGVALGYVYDLRLSRSAWSWLPLALALPLLPVHAWLGTTGEVPPGLLTLVPTAVLAGAALALANGLVDADRDRRAGAMPVVVRLGPERAWAVHVALLAGVAFLAIWLSPRVATGAAEPLALLRTWGLAAGLGGLALGAAALRVSRAAVRERGWEVEAVGVAAIGLGWLAGTAGAAGGGGAGLA